jgi:hypothetical protein
LLAPWTAIGGQGSPLAEIKARVLDPGLAARKAKLSTAEGRESAAWQLQELWTELEAEVAAAAGLGERPALARLLEESLVGGLAAELGGDAEAKKKAVERLKTASALF